MSHVRSIILTSLFLLPFNCSAGETTPKCIAKSINLWTECHGSYSDGEGNTYEGEYFNGLMDGVGIFIFKDGTKYTGDFTNGQRHGFGKLEFPDGSYYEGIYKYDKRNGRGVEQLSDGESYTGTFKDGFREGHGQLIYGNGDKYIGDFHRGMKNGYGTYTFKSGTMYRGHFHNELRHGKGMLITGNHQVLLRYYWNDKPSTAPNSNSSIMRFCCRHKLMLSNRNSKRILGTSRNQLPFQRRYDH